MAEMPVLRRHDLVHLRSGARIEGVAAAPEVSLADWVAQGRPFIARRPACADRGDRVPIGLPLPPALGKARLALAVAPEAMAAIVPPPLLADAAAVAPPGWAQRIGALLAAFPEARCFGSLAWQHLTGLAYLSAGSDLDLLLPCASVREADAAAARLAAIGAEEGPAIDGELVAPSGEAVQWREWASAAAQVAVKAIDGVRLARREEVFP